MSAPIKAKHLSKEGARTAAIFASDAFNVRGEVSIAEADTPLSPSQTVAAPPPTLYVRSPEVNIAGTVSASRASIVFMTDNCFHTTSSGSIVARDVSIDAGCISNCGSITGTRSITLNSLLMLNAGEIATWRLVTNSLFNRRVGK